MKYLSFKNIDKKDMRLALTTGILLGLSFPPFPFPYLMFAALVPYFVILNRREGLAEINRITYFTFWVFSIISLYWVGSWTKEADPFLMISGVALLFFNPILFLIPSTIFYLVKKRFGKSAAFYFFPFFWVNYEYLYSVTEFRFPWLTLGSGLTKFQTYIQSADIIGVYGLSLLVLYFNLLLFLQFKEYTAGKRINKKLAAFLILILILPLLYGSIKLQKRYDSGKALNVGLIQPNLNPWAKWDAGNLNEQLDLYLNLSEKAINEKAELIVWPESALPVYLLSGSYSKQVNRIHDFVDSNNIFLLTGMPDVRFYDSTNAPWDAKKSSVNRYYYTTYNSVLAFTPKNKEVQRYGKIKLVPFGEKVPYVNYIPFIGDLIKWNVGISSWNTGQDTIVFNLINAEKQDTIKTAALICIESIYPDFTAQFVQRGAEFLTVVTNDSWYGNSSGPYQHKDISVLRAVENRRYVIRTANGGISCIIDPNGKILYSTNMFERAYLTGTIYLNDELTFYSKYPLIVPFISVVISFGFILFSIVIIRKI